jgi:flagellar biosynthesis protein FlhG
VIFMAQVWPIGGGKGGTGKSFLTGNLGILLARQRFRTLLIDADLGAANLHTVLGLAYPEKSLSDFLNRGCATLQETVIETPIPNLCLISGARNKLDVANLPHEQKMKLLRAISRLDYDFVLLDLSAGTSFNTLDFFTLSDSGIFVCCPEPTSIENLYRLIRSVYSRKIRQILKTPYFRTLTERAEPCNPDTTVHSPEYLLDVLREMDPEKGRELEEILQAFHFKLVVNQLRKQDSPKIGSLICRIVERHLSLKIQFIGNVRFDERVHEGLCRRGPYVERYAYSQVTADLKALTKGIVNGILEHVEVPSFGEPDMAAVSA